MSTPWLSNTYLVVDNRGVTAVLIEAGGPVEPLLEQVERQRYELTHVLLTHHHQDHIAELGSVLERFPSVQVLAHPLERPAIMGTTGDLIPGETLVTGELTFEPLHTPGHTAGMVSLLAGGTDVFTGDTLFK